MYSPHCRTSSKHWSGCKSRSVGAKPPAQPDEKIRALDPEQVQLEADRSSTATFLDCRDMLSQHLLRQHYRLMADSNEKN